MTNGIKDSSKDFLRAIFFLVITQLLLFFFTATIYYQQSLFGRKCKYVKFRVGNCTGN